MIYRQIPEQAFAVLFSEKDSRPNAPVNTLVAALILKHQRGWSYQELLEHIDFDLKTRMALGLRELGETPFVESTIFTFQNRLAAHQARTGQNLLEWVFDQLTGAQLEALQLKTSIQRADSFLAASNIRDYSLLQLIIEVLQRFCRLLSEDAHAHRLPESLAPYVKQPSGKYIYKLEAGSLEDELQQLGQIYQTLLATCQAAYGDTEAYRILQRVFGEHFTVANDHVQLRPAEQLGSDCLQSPDDPEATYRKKSGQTSKGQLIHGAETCHPANELNLITDVAVKPNNTDDATILAERAEPMTEKTPDLEELHVDGGYGSDEADEATGEQDIALIQTAIKGRSAKVPMQIEPAGDGYEVRCPHGQTVEASRTPSRWKAEFSLGACSACPLAEECPTVEEEKRLAAYTSRRIKRPVRSDADACSPCRTSAGGFAQTWKRPSGRCKQPCQTRN